MKEKLQTPNSKLQRNFKLQAPTANETGAKEKIGNV